MRQNSVVYENLYNLVECLIFGVFLPGPTPSELDPSLPLLPVLIILLFMYILRLLVLNKPVSEHKFENKYLVRKEHFLQFSEKHF